MKKKLITTIILGICMSSIIISCGDSKKDDNKKETKTVATSSVSAEKSTKTAETSTIKETETAKNEEDSSKENKINEENKTSVESNPNQQTASNNEVSTENNTVNNNTANNNTANNNTANNNTEENENNGSTSQVGNNTPSVSEEKNSEQTEVQKSIYKDGTYTGYGEGMNGKVKVNVTISGDKIISISLGENSEDEEYLGEAKGVIDRIIASQSTSVDVVSGATYSSNGIIGGVNEALSKAKN